MKNWLIIAISWSFISVLSAQQVEEKAAKKEVVAGVSPIEGQWRGVGGFEGLKKLPNKEISGICMQFQSQQVIVSLDEDVRAGICRYEANNRMYLFVKVGKKMLQIPVVYKLEKDKLTICHYVKFEENSDKFPKSTEPGAGLYVVEFKRAKLEKRLEGTWTTDRFSVNGELLLTKVKMVFEKGSMSVTVGDDDEVVMPFLTETHKDPKRLLTSEDGDLSHCIYKIENGTLMLSLLDKSDEYPKDFKTGEGTVVFSLKKTVEKKP